MDLCGCLGLLMIMIDYCIDLVDVLEFLCLMVIWCEICRCDGVCNWVLLWDLEYFEMWFESYYIVMWDEYVCYNLCCIKVDFESYEELYKLYCGDVFFVVYCMIECYIVDVSDDLFLVGKLELF